MATITQLMKRFLKEEKILTEFLEVMFENEHYDIKIDFRVNFIQELLSSEKQLETNFFQMIRTFGDWSSTRQGFDFWRTISVKWRFFYLFNTNKTIENLSDDEEEYWYDDLDFLKNEFPNVFDELKTKYKNIFVE